MHPTKESGVALSLVDPAGHEVRLNAGGYLEPGYSGVISVDITAREVRHFEDDADVF